jgi:hypothetical protein
LVLVVLAVRVVIRHLVLYSLSGGPKRKASVKLAVRHRSAQSLLPVAVAEDRPFLVGQLTTLLNVRLRRPVVALVLLSQAPQPADNTVPTTLGLRLLPVLALEETSLWGEWVTASAVSHQQGQQVDLGLVLPWVYNLLLTARTV